MSQDPTSDPSTSGDATPEGPDEPDEPSGGPSQRRPDGGAPAGAAGHVAGGPGASVSPVAQGDRPPRPPRRTGVFVDHDDLREHVGGLLRAILGGYEVDAWGNFTFTHDDARVFVTVGPSPIGPQVGVLSVTNLDVDLSPPLGQFLLTTNHQLGFGSFSYDTDNRAVWLRHTLLGTMLDGPELQSAVASVASTAAHFDDAIRDRFGGRAFHDAPEDIQRGTRPPEPTADRPPNASGYL